MYLTLGLISITILFGSYIFKLHRKPSLAESLIIFLALDKICELIAIPIPTLYKNIIVVTPDNEQMYVVIGIFAVMWISIEAILKTLIK